MPLVLGVNSAKSYNFLHLFYIFLTGIGKYAHSFEEIHKYENTPEIIGFLRDVHFLHLQWAKPNKRTTG